MGMKIGADCSRSTRPDIFHRFERLETQVKIQHILYSMK